MSTAAPSADEIGRIFAEEHGRAVAALLRRLGGGAAIQLAEDAVQDAFVVALDRWPRAGLPANPGGWITTTARRKALDRLRRERRGIELMEEVGIMGHLTGDDASLAPGVERAPDAEEEADVRDDHLRLIFLCGHPALSREAQVALTLRLVGGLSTAQVAAALLVSEPTMAQRLVRAKRRIAAAHIPLRMPPPGRLAERLGSVLGVLYLIHTVGTDRPLLVPGPSLTSEAVRLTRLLVDLLPGEPEVRGLLALMLLTDSRAPARHDDEGRLVLLRDQDRSRWVRRLLEEGQSLVRACIQQDRPGPYQVHAAIAAVHADAVRYEQTDWRAILELYDHLIAIDPSPVVALNRAVAVAEVEGPEAGLALVDSLTGLARYGPWHATRGELLVRLDRAAPAADALQQAAALAEGGTAAHLRRRAAEVRAAALQDPP